MIPWEKDHIKIQIGTEVIDCPGAGANRRGFGLDCDYGGLSRKVGIHTVQELEDLFSDIIVDLGATLKRYEEEATTCRIKQ